jgi:hypothetical protein
MSTSNRHHFQRIARQIAHKLKLASPRDATQQANNNNLGEHKGNTLPLFHLQEVEPFPRNSVRERMSEEPLVTMPTACLMTHPWPGNQPGTVVVVPIGESILQIRRWMDSHPLQSH